MTQRKKVNGTLVINDMKEVALGLNDMINILLETTLEDLPKIDTGTAGEHWQENLMQGLRDQGFFNVKKLGKRGVYGTYKMFDDNGL